MSYESYNLYESKVYFIRAAIVNVGSSQCIPVVYVRNSLVCRQAKSWKQKEVFRPSGRSARKFGKIFMDLFGFQALPAIKDTEGS